MALMTVVIIISIFKHDWQRLEHV